MPKKSNRESDDDEVQYLGGLTDAEDDKTNANLKPRRGAKTASNSKNATSNSSSRKRRKCTPEPEVDVQAPKGKKAKASKPSKAKDFDIASMLGRYVVSCPYVKEQWSYEDVTFTMTISSDDTHLWASFDLGVFKGIFRSKPNAIPTRLPCTLEVSFRGREDENHEGQMYYDDETQKGKITFRENGKLEGYLDLPLTGEDGKFKGSRTGEGNVAVEDMKKEWKGYNGRRYNYESSARWGGGWGYVESDEEEDGEEDQWVGDWGCAL